MATRTHAVEWSDRLVMAKWVTEADAKEAMATPPAALAAMGGEMIWRSKVVPRWTVVRVPSGMTGTAALVLAGLSEVDKVVFCPGVTLLTTPNDDLWPQQAQAFANICLPSAWNLGTAAVKLIAVVDSGVDYNHPDLVGNMWINLIELPGLPTEDRDGNGIPHDVRGAAFAALDCGGLPIQINDPIEVCATHGTGVASIIGAVGNNEVPNYNSFIAGVAWKCQIIPVKCLGDAPYFLMGLEYAYEKGARIINCSWTVGGDFEPMEDFILATPDALYVVAAGNTGADLDDVSVTGWYPQRYRYSNVIVVGAVGLNDQPYGGPPPSNFGRHTVTFYAPGENLLALAVGGGVTPFDATSAAAPVVTGIAALMWMQVPNYTPAQIREKLMSTVDLLPSLAGLCITQNQQDTAGGRVNAAKALGVPCN